MAAVRGHYNGSVVVLNEPAPANQSVDVIVQFPDATSAEAAVNGLPQHLPSDEELKESAARLRQRTEEWRAEDAGNPNAEQEWEEFKEAMDRNRRDSGGVRMLWDDSDQRVGDTEPIIIVGECRNGKLEIGEVPPGSEEAMVLVTFLPNSGVSSQQVADLRFEFGEIVEEWYSEAKRRRRRSHEDGQGTLQR